MKFQQLIPIEASNARAVRKICDFRQVARCNYVENGTGKAQCFYERRIGSHMQPIEMWHWRWPWVSLTSPTHPYFKFWIFFHMCGMVHEARHFTVSSGRVVKSQGKGVIWVFIGNALYSIARGTHTKTAESIEMPFGTMSGLGRRNCVLHGVTIPEEGAILGETCTGPCSGAHTIGADAWLQAVDEYYRPWRGWDCTPLAKSDIYDCLVHVSSRQLPTIVDAKLKF